MKWTARSSLVSGAVLLLTVALSFPDHASIQLDWQTALLPARTEAECTQLAALRLDHVQILSSRVQAAAAIVEGARLPDMTGTPQGAPVSGLPAFCRVIGSIHPVPGSDIKFELWMPMVNWNGRFFGANNGGLAGSIRFDDIAAAIRNGAAGAGSDSGHDYRDPTWAVGHPEPVRDYGWRAIH